MEKKFNLVLASSSPRRKDILTKMGLEFEVIPSDYEEVLESFDFSYEKIEELAYKKAEAVLNCIKKNNALLPCPTALILSADTVVVLENQILGKPRDRSEAVDMLKSLSGKKHSVVTSICIINSATSEKKITSTTSYVEFQDLREETINDYVLKFNPLDKAGSYGIQELPDGFVKSIEGSFENIIGLCSSATLQLLTEANL